MKAYARGFPSEIDDPTDRADARLDANGRARVLTTAIDKLSTIQRNVLLLHAWADLTPDEIATALDLAPGTVRSHLSRARQRLSARRVDETVTIGATDMMDDLDFLRRLGRGPASGSEDESIRAAARAALDDAMSGKESRSTLTPRGRWQWLAPAVGFSAMAAVLVTLFAVTNKSDRTESASGSTVYRGLGLVLEQHSVSASAGLRMAPSCVSGQHVCLPHPNAQALTSTDGTGRPQAGSRPWPGAQRGESTSLRGRSMAAPFSSRVRRKHRLILIAASFRISTRLKARHVIHLRAAGKGAGRHPASTKLKSWLPRSCDPLTFLVCGSTDRAPRQREYSTYDFGATLENMRRVYANTFPEISA